VQYDSDCYIREDDRAKLLQEDQSKEIDHQQAMEDDRPQRDDQYTMLESSRFGHYRRVTRMESYTYPTPVIPGGDDGAGPMTDSQHDAPQDDKHDIDNSIQETMVNTSKPLKRSESATPRTTTPRAPRS
jgi:hypothetical protein